MELRRSVLSRRETHKRVLRDPSPATGSLPGRIAAAARGESRPAIYCQGVSPAAALGQKQLVPASPGGPPALSTRPTLEPPKLQHRQSLLSAWELQMIGPNPGFLHGKLAHSWALPVYAVH